jgi:very-short-patch-repair endonuclease
LRSQKLISRAKQMRRDATPPERRLWAYLKADQLGGAKFRRQAVIGTYIADFACRTPMMLVIELDGDTHASQQSYDADRTRYLEDRGYRVLRFANRDVMQNVDVVIATIAAALSTAFKG